MRCRAYSGLWVVFYVLTAFFLFSTTLSAAPTVNGLFYGDNDQSQYQFLAENGTGRGTMYYYLEQDVLYIAVIVSPSVNDNVIDDGQTAYANSVGWTPPHQAEKLIQSDHLNFTFTADGVSYTWKQGYLYDADGDKSPSEADWLSDYHDGSLGGGTLPPGLVSASSMQWNMNNSPWVSTFTGTSNDWKSPYDPASPNSLTAPYELGYPHWDSVNEWEWAMVYEMSIPISNYSGAITLQVNSAHNSPSKDDEEDIPIPPVTLTDYGDLPSPFHTLSTDNGASHLILTENNPTLGSSVDAENDGQPDGKARGDDNNYHDDEDGIQFKSAVSPDYEAILYVTVKNTGYLSAWMDFNGNGNFDTGEQFLSDVTLSTGTHSLTFTPPADAVTGVTYARFRYSTETGLTANGSAADGEVEDYRIEILSLQYVDYGDAFSDNIMNVWWPEAGRGG
ncbi:MAG: GEVED domain-containing protein [candidate division KSB1 bacterium]|nr:GEVED domain-containing protein [candidate division KSB1 bacterium]